MTISVGDTLPDVKLMTPTANGPQPVQSADALGSGRVVLFAVPGAFTPTCSDYHLPGFVLRARELKDRGIDTVACVSVNDPFVMGAWGESQDVDGNVLMLADGNAEFARALGLELDASGAGLGTRSQRYAAVVENGVVQELLLEHGAGLDVSTADAVLAKL